MATQTLTTEAAQRMAQVRIQLKSQEPDVELPENIGSILVSTEFRRFQLSTLVNRLLSTEKPIPFEFVVNGVFLRTSLDDCLTDHGLSSETTLQVEYVRAQIPPQHISSFEHDDWVSSVDVLSSSSPAGRAANLSATSHRILSGSYDGLLRTWNASGDCTATSTVPHGLAIKSAKFLSPTRIVSSSIDRTVRIWTYTETGPTTGTITPTLDLLNHTASVDRVAVHAPSGKILTASSDGTLSIFSTSKSSLPEAPPHLLPTAASSKRRKLSSSSSAQVPHRGALATLKSHTHAVSDAQFAPTDPTVAYSASWDRTLKTWDLTSGACVATRSTAHALLSVCALPEVGLVAAGTAARHVALVDVREGAGRVVPLVLRGHGNAVVALAAEPGNGFLLGSAGHDGAVRVWDVRMGRAEVGGDGGNVAEALYVLGGEKRAVGGEGQKVFGLAWDRDWGLVCGGEDKKVQVFKGR